MDKTINISPETLLKLDESFNIASLLGKAMLTAAHQTQPAENAPADPADNPADGSIFLDANGKPVFPSDKYEANISNQMKQLAALFTPSVKAFIEPSALFKMFLFGVEQLGLDKNTIEKDYFISSNAMRVSVAWIIAKRVFSIRHSEETIRIISLAEYPEKVAGSIPFLPFDETDKTFVTESCSAVRIDDLATDEALSIALDRISQLPPQSDRYIPLISKPFREQRAIAARRDFAPVPVGGGATIRARIGKAGEGPVELSEFEMLIQQVIGEMIQYRVRLDGEGSLPIRVTPEQIYRWMVNDLTNTLHPSPETRSTIVTAVDKLIQTPAELHILEQLEKHTKLKSKPGYKKLIKNEGKIIGTLITGKHYGASYNGKALEDTFVIYDMPMFFYYSSFTGQLLKVDSKLLTGSTAKIGQPRNTYNDIILREHILYRVNLIKREKKDKNKNIAKQSRYEKKQPKLINNFTKTILLETLAEECEIGLDTPKKLEIFRNKVLD